jgi:uncharacterized iron-regulated membrane protein
MYTTTIIFASIVSLIFLAVALIPVILAYVEAFGVRNKYKRRYAMVDAHKCLGLWCGALFVVPFLVILFACFGQAIAAA